MDYVKASRNSLAPALIYKAKRFPTSASYPTARTVAQQKGGAKPESPAPPAENHPIEK